MFTVLAVVNMDKCCARSINVEKESLKDLTLIPNPTLTIILRTKYFGYDDWKKNHFVGFKLNFRL